MSTLAASRISEAEKQLYFPLEASTSFEHFVSGIRLPLLGESFCRSNDSTSCFSLGNHRENMVF